MSKTTLELDLLTPYPLTIDPKSVSMGLQYIQVDSDRYHTIHNL